MVSHARRPSFFAGLLLPATFALAACSGGGAALPASPAAGGLGASQFSRGSQGSLRSVTTLENSGKGSLRAAIASLNKAKAKHATITFAVRGTIALSSNLPVIAAPVTIDATKAPGYNGNAPVIGINANGHAGLVFAPSASQSQLLALSIGGAKNDGVRIEASSMTVNRNYVGLGIDGKVLANGGDGIYVTSASSGDRIGLNTSGASGVVGNVISGNRGNGLKLQGSANDIVVANRIGTGPTGQTAMPNGLNGIVITANSHDNEIGGARFVDSATGRANNPTGNKGTVRPVFVVPPDGNLVSGNKRNGILIAGGSTGNMLNGNFIGTTADGDDALGNGRNGVWIHNADDNTLAGCKFRNNPFVYYNVMSGNGRNGLRVTNSNGVVVQGNFFGIAANNADTIANAGDGILIDGTSQDTTVGGVIPLGNVSAGNVLNGIEVKGTASGFTTFNTFGGLLAFKGAAPNGNDGLLITSTGGNQTVRTNVFSGNKKYGLEIGGSAQGVDVQPNIVGLNTVGNALLANGSDGVHVGGNAHDVTIGGYSRSVIPQNTFSGNRGYGLAIVDQAHDITVFNTWVGTSVTGLTALANRLGGIYVAGSANHNLIGGKGGTADKPRYNLVSGNTGNGVTLAAGTSYIRVIDNWIGLDRKGLRTLPNSGEPISVDPGSTHDTIQGNKT